MQETGSLASSFHCGSIHAFPVWLSLFDDLKIFLEPHPVKDYLWGHVVWCPTHGVRLDGNDFGKAHVREPDVAIRPHQNVLRLSHTEESRADGGQSC